ncbi:MAG: DUF2378 family protein [Myxococcota bacterium]|nr:DUF2378 family protein [Myxococcota bacterium]
MHEEGFAPFDFDAPLDVDARLAALPAGRRVRGFVFNAVARRLGLDEPKRTAFREYPLEDFVRLLAQAERDGEGARRLCAAGEQIGPALQESTAGRVLFALIGGDLMRAGQYAERAWRLGVSFGDLRTTERPPRAFDVSVRDVWAFHAYLFGAIKGTCELFEPDARIRYRWVSLSAFDVRVEW